MNEEQPQISTPEILQLPETPAPPEIQPIPKSSRSKGKPEKKKRGVPSALKEWEIDFIRKNSMSMSIEDMAAHLKRDKRSVKKYIAKYQFVRKEGKDTDDRKRELKRLLEKESFWPVVQEQLDDVEKEFFVDQWVNNILQFEQTSPLLHTEKMQLVDLIRNQILIDRSFKRQQSNTQEILHLKKLIEEEEAKPDIMKPGMTDPSKLKNVDLIRQLYEHKHMLESVSVQYTKELKEIQGFIKFIREGLKATRDQRIKNISDAKTDFVSKTKLLEEEEMMHKEGKELILFRLAMEKERLRLQKPHIYMDGEEGYPLLTPELVEKLRIENNV